MEIEKKLKKNCRICEKSSSIFIDLTSPNNQSYVEQFLSCANVTFQIDDKLPKHLCRLCTTQLKYAYRFKQKCEQTQTKLTKLLEESVIANEEMLGSKAEIVLEEIFESKDNILIDQNCGDNSMDNHSFVEEVQSFNIIKEEGIKKESFGFGTAEKIYKNQKKTQFKCDHCRKGWYSKTGLKQHMVLKHKMAPNLYECPHCNQYFDRVKYLSHLSTHEKPFKCNICSKFFSYPHNLRRHISDVHQKLKNFKCDLCGVAYAQKSALEQHIETIHLKKKYKFPCNVCDKKYTTKYMLELHRFKYHLSAEEKELLKLKLFKCRFCNKKHKSEADLQYHESQMLCNENTKKDKTSYICQYCGKVMSYGAFYEHIKYHNDDKPYKCEICKKTFKTSGTLDFHRRTHFNDKRYKCNFCDMKFIQAQQLTTHTRTHTGEKPYKCEYCGKGFALKTICTVHQRLHTGEKPYHCEKCKDSFIDLNSLKRHRKKEQH